MTNSKLDTAVLTIAGSDSCGGAGIQADLKTFSALGVYGASVVTALTAQNTKGVEAVDLARPEMVRAQLLRVLDELPVKAIKTGMLGQPGTIEVVFEVLEQFKDIPLVLDPVMVATSGARLADTPTIDAMRNLMKRSSLVTPNRDEISRLCGIPIEQPGDLPRAAAVLLESGCRAVLLKGGHFQGDELSDLFVSEKTTREWRHRRLPGNYHGTGCTLASGIAAGIARGLDLEQAIDEAERFTQAAMRHGTSAGDGRLILLNHHFRNRIPL